MRALIEFYFLPPLGPVKEVSAEVSLSVKALNY
jgi:hypothetical protein